MQLYFNGGCTFQGKEEKEDSQDRTNVTITSYYAMQEVQATVKKDQVKKNTTALLPASMKITCGKGTAILCGVHPEFQPHQMMESKDVVVQPVLNNDVQRYEFMKYLLQPIFGKAM